MKGVLITFEGGDGSGKGTIAELLVAFLKKEGFDVEHFREPGSTPLAEEIREVLLKPRDGDPVSPVTETLLFEASRAQYVQETLKPALAAGKIVVQERFYDATTAYQGYGRGIDLDMIRTVNKHVRDGVVPTITFLLDLSPAVGLKRCNREYGNQGDRIEQEAIEFHEKVRAGYHEMASLEPDRFFMVDVENNDIEATFEIIKEKSMEILHTKG